MCGACGRTVVADELLGPVRTQRQQFIVASTISALCAQLPGVPGVTAAGDTWLLRWPTGAVRQCSTVGEVWAAVVAGAAAGNGTLGRLRDRLSAERQNAEGLPRVVIDAGLSSVLERLPEAQADVAG